MKLKEIDEKKWPHVDQNMEENIYVQLGSKQTIQDLKLNLMLIFPSENLVNEDFTVTCEI